MRSAKELAAGTTPSLRVNPPMNGAAVTLSCASAYSGRPSTVKKVL
jgi:hypothetical protein